MKEWEKREGGREAMEYEDWKGNGRRRGRLSPFPFPSSCCLILSRVNWMQEQVMDLRELSTFFFLSYQTGEKMRGKGEERERESWRQMKKKVERRKRRDSWTRIYRWKRKGSSRGIWFFSLLGLMMGFGWGWNNIPLRKEEKEREYEREEAERKGESERKKGREEDEYLEV